MKSTRRISAFPIVLGLSVFCGEASGEVDFARDIRPILNANCIACHGGVKAAGYVSFVYEDRVVNFEAKSGYTVVKPRDLEGSEMLLRITTDDEDDHMPPPEDHQSLSTEEIALIKQWIEEGAKWGSHWAFQPPKKPPVPETSFDDQAMGTMDRFLFSRQVGR